MAENPQSSIFGSRYQKLKEAAERGITTPLGYWRVYLKDGFRLDSRGRNLGMKFNLTVMGDGGYISADDDMENAFPELEGFDLLFHQLMVTMVEHLFYVQLHQGGGDGS